MSVWRWFAAHRTLARIFLRPWMREWVSRRVWRDLESNPQFRADT